MLTEKQLEETISLANSRLVKYTRQVLMELWGTSEQGTMDRAKEFCKQHGFECDYDQEHSSTIKLMWWTTSPSRTYLFQLAQLSRWPSYST